MRSLDINDYPQTKWIASPQVAADGTEGLWHLGKRHESRGSRTGTLMSVYYKTACSGRQLGGPWGQMERTEYPASGICPRCSAIYAKSQVPALDYSI